MTDRLYYSDSYLCDFRASVVDRSPDGSLVYLDRTAFYPTSGGQPHDLGSIAGVPVTNVIDEEDRIAHQVAAPVDAGPADCAIDWTRRFDHMQQHTGQHLLSAVFQEPFGLKTVSFHLGADSATIDLEGGAVDAKTVREVERRANQIVWENRPVAVTYELSSEVLDLRKPSERQGTLRIVAIQNLDRSACGGTHVRSTGEIGAILIRKLDKVRQTTRVEFLCGGRAVRRARADYEALYQTAQLYRAQMDEVPALVAAQLESANAAEKARRKLDWTPALTYRESIARTIGWFMEDEAARVPHDRMPPLVRISFLLRDLRREHSEPGCYPAALGSLAVDRKAEVR